MKYESAYMVKQGFGSIVNVSSGAGAVGVGDMEPYAPGNKDLLPKI